METDNGWTASANGWIELQDRGDFNRTLLLDPVMLDCCGDTRGKRVLDAGCGEGRFARMLAEQGASVTAVDLVDRLVRAAAERGGAGQACAVATAEGLPFAAASFELVVSYLTLIDINDFRSAITEMARVLSPGGRLVAANLGFVSASLGWQRDEDGRRLYQRIDRYAEEWAQVYEWAGMRIRNWHRPLSAYMQAYLGAGLTLQRFLEPVPEDGSLRDDPRFEDWYRVPLFSVMVWQKPADETPRSGRLL